MTTTALTKRLAKLRRIKKHGIHVYYEEPNGTTGVINYLSGDNVEASRDSGAKAALLAKARKIAGDWSKIYPETKFFVR